MGCNCEGKKYSISMGCCQPVLGPVENYYTKYQIDEIIENLEISGGCCITEDEVDDKISAATSGLQHTLIAGDNIIISGNVISASGGNCDLSDYYTKEEVDGKIPSLNGYATEQWVLDKHYISGVDLSDYATKLFVSGYTYDKETIDRKVASGGTFDPTNYYNKTEVNNIVNSAKTEVENEIPSLNGYATEQWVLDKHYISGVDLSDYALKSEIPTVPTSNSAFTNDMGYLTEHQSLSAYSTTQEVNTLINQSVSGKQDTLSAGTNITIVDNVISSTGGGGVSSGDVQNMINQSTSGINNSLTAHTSNTTIHVTYNDKVRWNAKPNVWCGTEAEWAQISGSTQTNTLYLIHQ